MSESTLPELISLADLIAEVKADLLSRPLLADLDAPLYYLQDIELTAQVVASRTRDSGGKGGIKLSVLGVSADAGVQTKSVDFAQTIQTVRIKLSPLVDREEYVKQQTQEVQRRIKESAVWNTRSSGEGPREQA
jgi:hypothetical protein